MSASPDERIEHEGFVASARKVILNMDESKKEMDNLSELFSTAWHSMTEGLNARQGLVDEYELARGIHGTMVLIWEILDHMEADFRNMIETREQMVELTQAINTKNQERLNAITNDLERLSKRQPTKKDLQTVRHIRKRFDDEARELEGNQ